MKPNDLARLRAEGEHEHAEQLERWSMLPAAGTQAHRSTDRRPMMRCIATPTRDTRCTRCTREATTRDGTYTCHAHRRPRWLLDIFQSASTRRMLAHAAWETLAEGQHLIDAYTRRAA